MWVSSFARGGGGDASAGSSTADRGSAALVRAHVWGSELVPRSHGTPGKERGGVPFGVNDALTLAATADMALLRRLRVVNGSFVAVELNGRTHVARLVLVAPADAYTGDREDGGAAVEADSVAAAAVADVTLSPLLAFNLGIPLHAIKSGHVTVAASLRAISTQELGLSAPSSSSALALPSSFRRHHQEHPVPATYALIAPLLVSSLSCSDHAVMRRPDGLLEAVRSFFASAQVLQTGDVFAIALRETSQTHALAGGDRVRAAAAYAPYKSIDIPASCLVSRGVSSDADSPIPSASLTVLMPPALNVDTSLVFFRVEKLEAGGNPAIAYSVSEATELVQGTPVSASAPDETSIKRFLSYCRYHDATRILPAPVDTSLPTPAVNKLYDVLYPSMLCDIPTSVLLSGPRGVGKRTLVYQAAKYMGILVIEVPFTELTGQSEFHLLENVREQVAKARALSPCLLYISHFFPVDKENDEAELRIGAALSECIRTLSQHSHNIPLIACVEDKSDVPKYIRQCFLYEMQLEAPDLPGRIDFLRHVVSSVRLSGDVDLKEVAQLTAGRTFGELSSIVADAGAFAVNRAIGDEEEDTDEDAILDLLSAPAAAAPEVSTSELAVTTGDLEAAIKSQQARSSSNSKVSNASIPNVKWSDVGGLEDVKDEILDVVQLPINHPELFASGVRQRSGILLYGPPGTGKTLLAKAIATECNLNFLSVKGPELLNMYIGESEKNVRQVFAKARSCRPCILFFDELDSLAPMRGRGSDSGGVMDRVVSQLLTEIDGLSGGGNDQVFVIGATNRPDLLETGLLRPGRFDRLLYLGICSERPAQLKVLQAQTRKFAMADDVDLEAVVAQCPLHFTGADFYALSSSALAAALKDRVEELDRQIEEINAADCYSSSPMTARMLLNRLPPEELRVRVRQAHLLAALASVVPSVSPAELAHYENLKRQYSSK